MSGVWDECTPSRPSNGACCSYYLRGHRKVEDHEDGEDDAGEKEGRDQRVLLEVRAPEHLVQAGGVIAGEGGEEDEEEDEGRHQRAAVGGGEETQEGEHQGGEGHEQELHAAADQGGEDHGKA